MNTELLINDKTYTLSDSDMKAIVAGVKEASDSRIAHEFFDTLTDFVDGNSDTLSDACQNIRVIPPEKPHITLNEAARMILTKYFPDGFRPKLKRDYILFRNHAEEENIHLPSGNDELRHVIEAEGTSLDGAIFIVSKTLADQAGKLIMDIQDTKALVIFYAPLMEALMPALKKNLIYSLKMFRDFLHAQFPMLYRNAQEGSYFYKWEMNCAKLS